MNKSGPNAQILLISDQLFLFNIFFFISTLKQINIQGEY